MSTLSQQADAEYAFRTALEIDPRLYQALCGLGVVSRERLDHDEAIACARRAIALRPAEAVSWNNLAIALVDLGRVDEAVRLYRISMSLKSRLFSITFGNYLLALNYSPGLSPAEVADEHRRWGCLCQEAAPQPAPHDNPPDPERVLRIGFVSADFRHHSVAYFLIPVLPALNRRRVRVTCYGLSPKADDFTRRIRDAADAWRDAGGWEDERFEAAVREDGIDILVDLGGHTGHNRLPLFARRPAPAPVTWLGYPATTGLTAMDWRLTDPVADPPGSEAFCTKKLYRLPRTFLCYSPVDAEEPVTPPSFEDTGVITFGSFNMLAKITPEVIALWAEILRAVPGSGLLLKAKGFSSSGVIRR
ncbi:MAG: tetratricopeptide repeat protein, partial [Caulobacter sp.]|nr:tetratricopeptide repeat protein [Caulobacter sp.]